jgi:hypothetical protein
MDFTERLASLHEKIRNQEDSIETEEATKTAFVMPFISTILGYDVFNPLEVIPEYTADLGTKKGEKVDYAVMESGTVRILIECKKSNEPLSVDHASQLFRYFATTAARIAILTNGEVYQFFTDLDKPNMMDRKPFLELDFNNMDETVIPELRKLTKEEFDLESVLNAAEELKYVGQIKRLVASQFRDPDPEWVGFFTTRVYEGRLTQRVRDQFNPLVLKATKQFLNEQVNDRLKSALGSDGYGHEDASSGDELAASTEMVDQESQPPKPPEASFEELEGHRIVTAIVCSEVEPRRVVKRKGKTHFSVLLDDSNRKPIARLRFGGRQKQLGVFDSEKNETQITIETLQDIYKYAD